MAAGSSSSRAKNNPSSWKKFGGGSAGNNNRKVANGGPNASYHGQSDNGVLLMVTSNRKNAGNSLHSKANNKSSYKHVPHREKPPHLVARRNARERRRVQAVNLAFIRLRKVLPIESRGKRVSKVKTLKKAMEYISHMAGVVSAANAASDDNNNPSSSSPPPLVPTIMAPYMNMSPISVSDPEHSCSTHQSNSGVIHGCQLHFGTSAAGVPRLVSTCNGQDGYGPVGIQSGALESPPIIANHVDHSMGSSTHQQQLHTFTASGMNHHQFQQHIGKENLHHLYGLEPCYLDGNDYGSAADSHEINGNSAYPGGDNYGDYMSALNLNF